jgi:hypothetical protein
VFLYLVVLYFRASLALWVLPFWSRFVNRIHLFPILSKPHPMIRVFLCPPWFICNTHRPHRKYVYLSIPLILEAEPFAFVPILLTNLFFSCFVREFVSTRTPHFLHSKFSHTLSFIPHQDVCSCRSPLAPPQLNHFLLLVPLLCRRYVFSFKPILLFA